MRSIDCLPTLIALFLFGIGLVGCSREPAPAPPAVERSADSDSASEFPEGLAELSEEDRADALAQKICPVSDEELGSMGAPIKVTIEGRDVFICCEGCRESLIAEPAKYLAKLDAAKMPHQ